MVYNLPDPQPYIERLSKLSDEDMAKYEADLASCGRALIKERVDGTAVYVPREEWLAEGFF